MRRGKSVFLYRPAVTNITQTPCHHLLSFVYEENSSVKFSRGAAVSRTTSLDSERSFWFLQSVLAGHAEGGCSGQVGPFHQSSNEISWLGIAPLEAMSAGLHSVGTYLQ